MEAFGFLPDRTHKQRGFTFSGLDKTSVSSDSLLKGSYSQPLDRFCVLVWLGPAVCGRRSRESLSSLKQVVTPRALLFLIRMPLNEVDRGEQRFAQGYRGKPSALYHGLVLPRLFGRCMDA